MSTPTATPASEESTSASSNLRPKSYSVSSSASIFTTSSISDEWPKNMKELSKSLSNRAFSSFEEDEDEIDGTQKGEIASELKLSDLEIELSRHSSSASSKQMDSTGSMASPSIIKVKKLRQCKAAQGIGTLRQNPLPLDQEPSSSKIVIKEKDYLTPHRNIEGTPRGNQNSRQLQQKERRLRENKKTGADQSPLYQCIMDMKGSPVSSTLHLTIIQTKTW